MKKIGIIGFGGLARVLACCFKKDNYNHFISLSEFNKNYNVYKSKNIFPLNEFDKDKYDALIAIANPFIRNKILYELPEQTTFHTYIHPTSLIMDKDNIRINEGSIILAGCVLSTNITLGKHTILNHHTTIGHDTITLDRFTTNVGVQIAGNCDIGENVSFGSNSCVKEKIKICDNVMIGMGAGVVKNIDIPGTYIGTPAHLFKK